MRRAIAAGLREALGRPLSHLVSKTLGSLSATLTSCCTQCMTSLCVCACSSYTCGAQLLQVPDLEMDALNYHSCEALGQWSHQGHSSSHHEFKNYTDFYMCTSADVGKSVWLVCFSTNTGVYRIFITDLGVSFLLTYRYTFLHTDTLASFLHTDTYFISRLPCRSVDQYDSPTVSSEMQKPPLQIQAMIRSLFSCGTIQGP